MTRMSKQGEKRTQFPRKRKNPSPKTGPKKDCLENGFKGRVNALEGELAQYAFIAKVK